MIKLFCMWPHSGANMKFNDHNFPIYLLLYPYISMFCPEVRQFLTDRSNLFSLSTDNIRYL